MAKTVALTRPNGQLENYLRAKGYKVVGPVAANRPGSHVDAVLYGADPSESPLQHSLIDADGPAGCPEMDDTAEPVGIDVRGMSPEQAASLLEERLRHRHWRR